MCYEYEIIVSLETYRVSASIVDYRNHSLLPLFTFYWVVLGIGKSPKRTRYMYRRQTIGAHTHAYIPQQPRPLEKHFMTIDNSSWSSIILIHFNNAHYYSHNSGIFSFVSGFLIARTVVMIVDFTLYVLHGGVLRLWPGHIIRKEARNPRHQL